MPKYVYTVRDKDGKTLKNVVDAQSRQTLIDQLQKQNLFIVSVQDFTAPSQKLRGVPKSQKRFKRKRVKLDDLLVFSRQLATMLEAGINLIRSLDVILSQQQSEEFHDVLTKIKRNVEQGSSLSSALSKHPKVFNQFWVSLTEVGEASGTIPTILNKLAFYLEQQAAFRSTIVSGLIYPAILFCVANGAIAFFALFVGPRFEDIFQKMNAELPLITVVLLGLFRFIKEKFLILVFVLAAAIVALRQYVKTYTGRMALERFLFRLPTFGEIYKLIIIERFTSQMAILIDSGVPILYALDITERLVDNITCSMVVNDIKESVKKGELLAQPMERSQFFPPMAIQMIMVGEETGELSKMMRHVAKFYQENVETFMKRFATIVEPFMLVFMGAIIGTIVVAMFLPMFNLGQLAGGG
jgi:type IV pilus assembly protein PilC